MRDDWAGAGSPSEMVVVLGGWRSLWRGGLPAPSHTIRPPLEHLLPPSQVVFLSTCLLAFLPKKVISFTRAGPLGILHRAGFCMKGMFT